MFLGVLLSIVPFVGWGVGDFLIQRSTRSIGIFKTLFFICAFSVPLLFPFVYHELPNLSFKDASVLTATSFVIFVYAIVLFEAFRIGKISIVESVVGLELPLTVAIAVYIGGETLHGLHLILFGVICVGILLASVSTVDVFGQVRHLVEKGIYIALIAAVLSACANYTIAVSAQQVSPLMAIWYTHVIVGIMSVFVLLVRGQLHEVFHDFVVHPYLILGQSAADTFGWLGYAYAVTYIPISLVITISESYIIFAALLGYWIGKESLHIHQKIGVAIALPSVVLFAALMA